jgi:hypothetical protein
MRWWPVRRRNGHAAKAAKDNANRMAAEADRAAPRVERTNRDADQVARRANRFTVEMERALHVRRGSA